MPPVSILSSRRLGGLRLALAASILLAPAAAEAFSTRSPQRAGAWHGQRVQRVQPARVTKRLPAKVETPTQAKATKPADAAPAKSPEKAGTWTAGDGGRACFRSRRKLWQADEGWVVKKVNVCS